MDLSNTNWTAPRFGERYDKLVELLGERQYDSAAIAALIRQDVKDAIKAGALPKGLKVSTTTDKFSGGSAIRMRIVECPVPVRNPEHAKWQAENPRGYDNPHERYTLEARQIRERLQAIHGAYNFDKSDRCSDYFHVNYYGQVDFDRSAERKAASSTQAKTMFRRLAGMVDALGAADSVSVYASSDVHRESAAYRKAYAAFGGEG